MPTFRDYTEAELIDACNVDAVADAGVVCRNVLERTGNITLAKLANWLVEVPVRVAIILLAAFVINRLVRRGIVHFVDGLTDDAGMRRAARWRRRAPLVLQNTKGQSALRSASRTQTIGIVLKSTASIVIYSLAALMALGEVGLDLAPLIAGAGIVGVALGFGAQSLVKDFLSGLFMLMEDQYGVGDVIDAGEATGTVEAVNLRTTRLRAVDGTVWHIPNGEISRVGNMSQQWARALLDVEVAYDTDIATAERVVKEVADALFAEDLWGTKIMEEPEVWGVQSLGASAVAIRLVVKTQPGEQWSVTRELNRRLKDRFDADGIEIPFPQQVTWVRREAGSSQPVDAPGDGA